MLLGFVYLFNLCCIGLIGFGLCDLEDLTECATSQLLIDLEPPIKNGCPFNQFYHLIKTKFLNNP